MPRLKILLEYKPNIQKGYLLKYVSQMHNYVYLKKVLINVIILIIYLATVLAANL